MKSRIHALAVNERYGAMANMITIFRMAGSILLLFPPIFSPWFYGIYLLCGLSDLADGIVARKTDTMSEFGARLDSAADLLFAAAALYKLLPALDIPKGLLVWTCLIAVIKIINILSGFVVQHKFVGVHSVLNKATGLLLFLLPLSLPLMDIRYSGYTVCTVATIAAIQEGHIIRTGKRELRPILKNGPKGGNHCGRHTF